MAALPWNAFAPGSRVVLSFIFQTIDVCFIEDCGVCQEGQVYHLTESTGAVLIFLSREGRVHVFIFSLNLPTLPALLPHT